MSRRWSLLILPLGLILTGCGGLTDEERQTAMGGALVPDAGAADRSAELAAEADQRRREAAEAAELARVEKAQADALKRQEALRLAAEQRAQSDFPEGIDRLFERDEEGLRLVGEDARDERWAEDNDRRARAMRERADRYERRYEREARARDRRDDRLRDRGYYEERYADDRPVMRRDEDRVRETQGRTRDTRRVEHRSQDDGYDDGGRYLR